MLSPSNAGMAATGMLMPMGRLWLPISAAGVVVTNGTCVYGISMAVVRMYISTQGCSAFLDMQPWKISRLGWFMPSAATCAMFTSIMAQGWISAWV